MQSFHRTDHRTRRVRVRGGHRVRGLDHYYYFVYKERNVYHGFILTPKDSPVFVSSGKFDALLN